MMSIFIDPAYWVAEHPMLTMSIYLVGSLAGLVVLRRGRS